MTTATLPTATLPACPQCKAPAKHALEMRNNDGVLTRMRYQCSGLFCDHVWNDPPLPKDTEAKPKPQHAWAHNLPLSPPTAHLTITAAPTKSQRYVAQPKPVVLPSARVCAWEPCGKAFTPIRSTGRYCSTHCMQKAFRRRKRLAEAATKATKAPKVAPKAVTTPPERTCDHCGERYTPDRSTNRFCSRECQVQARIRRKAEARGPRPLCLNCQQPFRRRAVDHVYCSPACKAAGKPKRVVRAQLSLTERTCERDGCGKPYVPQRTDQRFCSQKCLRTDSNDKRATWLTCPQCGERFRRRTSRHIWCTPACRDAAKAAEQADPGPLQAAETPQAAEAAATVAPATPEDVTGLLETLRARYAAAVDACDVLLALERGQR